MSLHRFIIYTGLVTIRGLANYWLYREWLMWYKGGKGAFAVECATFAGNGSNFVELQSRPPHQSKQAPGSEFSPGVSGYMENFHNMLTEEGFEAPVRSLYFFWVDRYIIEHKEITKELMHKLARGMVDKKFIHNCEIYDFKDQNYLLVCRFTLSLYEIVFFLPDCEGYLSGNKYFMRIKGKIDLVSLRQLFKVFRVKLWN